jgi:hypothetical protein
MIRIAMCLRSITQRYLVFGVGLSLWLAGQAYAETATYLCITEKAVRYYESAQNKWEVRPGNKKYLIRNTGGGFADETGAWRVFKFEQSDPMRDVAYASCDEVKGKELLVCDGQGTVLFWKRILRFATIWGNVNDQLTAYEDGSCTPL